MKPPERRSAERGSVLLQVLIAAALALIVVLILGQMTVMMQRFVSLAQVKMSLFEIRNNLLSTVLSDTAWKNTILNADNQGDPVKVLCLSGTNGDTPPPVDCSGQTDALTVVDGTGTKILDKTSLTQGFTRRGAACNTFDSAAGDPNCPIRVQAKWETECVSPCNMRAPPLKISFSFQYNDPDAVSSINTDQLNFVIRR